MNAIWNPEYETMKRAELEELQYKRLQTTLRWAYDNVPFYRALWDEEGIHPGDIRALDDLTKLPFMSQGDFRKAYPYGLFAVPLERVVRIHTSSGTTSWPAVVGYTRGDLNTWAELCARVAVAGGAQSHDVAQITFGYGLPTGAFGLQAGLERVGVTVIPASTGNTRRQLRIMRDYNTTLLVSAPSYALHLAQVAGELGYDFSQMSLRAGLFGAEPWTNRVRDEIEALMGISATDNYGLSQVMGPGISGECGQKDGLHINEDHFIAEVVDPETGEQLPEGKEGELVFTSLTKEAVPVVRYRTGDLASMSLRPCACGRTFARHTKVYSRIDDMLVIRGVNVYPWQVERVLETIEGVEPNFQIIVDRRGALDSLEVQIEMQPSFFPDEMRRLVEFKRLIEEKLRQELGVRVQAKLVEPRSIPKLVDRARRVVDRREQ
jgi:phenylacetate-CoA ligase